MKVFAELFPKKRLAEGIDKSKFKHPISHLPIDFSRHNVYNYLITAQKEITMKARIIQPLWSTDYSRSDELFVWELAQLDSCGEVVAGR